MSYNQYGNPYDNPYKYNNAGQSQAQYPNYGPPTTPSYQHYAQAAYPPQPQAQHPQHAPFPQQSTGHSYVTAQSYQSQQHHQAQSYGQYNHQSFAPSTQFAAPVAYGPPSLSNNPSSAQPYNQYGLQQNNNFVHAESSPVPSSAAAGYSAWRGQSVPDGNARLVTQQHAPTSQSSNNLNATYPNRTSSVSSQYGVNVASGHAGGAGPSPVQSPMPLPGLPKQAGTTASSSPSMPHADTRSNSLQPRTSISQSVPRIVPSPTLAVNATNVQSLHSPQISNDHVPTNAYQIAPSHSAHASPVPRPGVMPTTEMGQAIRGMTSPLVTDQGQSKAAHSPRSILNHSAGTPKQLLKAGITPSGSQIQQMDIDSTPSKPVEDLAYDMLLISMSEEYIDAAHKIGPRVALLGDKGELETYNGLIAAGLCCLEAALKNFTFPSRLEARITFRYATVMFEETENHEQLEKIISQGIMRCDRGKLMDAKYSFYHLLARASFRRNPKAALKALDTHVNEVEGHKNVPWIYALRLLRITLSLQIATTHDISIALQHLTILIDYADRNRDFGMIVMLATLEALIHLKTKAPDYIMNCQEAIAKARSLQMRKGAVELRQVWAMLSCIDLACGMLECNVKDIRSKVRDTQDRIEELVVNSELWTEDGTIQVALGEISTKQVTDYSSGILDLDSDGQAVLSIQWLDSPGAYAFGFLLGGVAGIIKNAIEEKNSQYIDGGLKILTSELQGKGLSTASSAALVRIRDRSDRNVSLRWYFQLYDAFLCCIRTDWTRATKVLRELRKTIDRWHFRNETTLQRWVTYLQGMIHQGTGNFEPAAEHFRSLLTIDEPKGGLRGAANTSSVEDELAILSRINLLFILRSPEHAPTTEAQQVLVELEELVPPSHRNPALRTAVALISAVLNPREAMAKTKSALRTALQASRSSGNAQLLAISMTAMVSIFFTDITTGDQAQQARSVALELTGRAGDPLWVAVANGMALQGELDPVKIEQRHHELDKSLDSMDENARKLFARSSGTIKAEDQK